MSLVLAISGPAAVGKTTICNRLVKEFKDDLKRLVTATTRQPREGEENGVDYHFLSQAEFEKKLGLQAFLEHEFIHGNHYGTLKDSLLQAQQENTDVLINIDVNGAASLREFCSQHEILRGCLSTIFIYPASIRELKERMLQRGTESSEQMEVRIRNAQAEMIRGKEFDFTLKSADRETDYNRIRRIYLQLKS